LLLHEIIFARCNARFVLMSPQHIVVTASKDKRSDEQESGEHCCRIGGRKDREELERKGEE